MTHPTEQLAGYIDGTLPPQEKASVDAHVSGCETCRRELELARAGQAALQRLPDLAPPIGISRAVEQQTARTDDVRAPSGGFRKTYQVLAGLAAAVVVGVFAFTMLSGPDRGSTTMSAALEVPSGGGGSLDAAAPEAIERDDTDGNFTGAELQYFAEREVAMTKRGARDTESVEQAIEETDAGAMNGTTLNDDRSKKSPYGPDLASDRKVQRCLRKAGAYESGGTLLRAFEAKLADVPAYFGVFLTGEEPRDPSDRIVVWVADTKGCDVIGFAQAYIIRPSPSPFPEELAGISPPPGL